MHSPTHRFRRLPPTAPSRSRRPIVALGFTDYGLRPTIVVAIVAESLAIVALTAYLALTHVGLSHPLSRLPSH
jgi:hypothetical protein